MQTLSTATDENSHNRILQKRAKSYYQPLTLALALALALAGAAPAVAGTLTVTNTNDSGAGSLREAVDNSWPGDIVNFALPPSSVITLSVNLVLCGGAHKAYQDLTIIGPGASQLAISGGGTTQVFSVCQGSALNLSGLTIKDGYFFAGGGIGNSGTLTISHCTLSGNSGGTGAGGGIYNQGTLTVANSTLSGNSAGFRGGGIFNTVGPVTDSVTVTNSTLTGNSSSTYGGAIDSGGSGQLTIANSTLSGNSAGIAGGGIMVHSRSTVRNTVLTNNHNGNCGSFSQFGLPPAASAGYNLSDDNTCQFAQTGDQINVVAPGLDPAGLKDNGGPTQTIALLPGSPAVDAGSCTDVSGNVVSTDQRGVARPQGAGCDIGAFELVQVVPFSFFSAKLDISAGPPPSFDLNATLTLGGSGGIDPLTQAVTLEIGSYTVTIPGGSFQQLTKGSKQSGYLFDGTINGAVLQLQIVPLGGNTFMFKAEGSPVNLAGTANPAPVSITIGNNTGTVLASF